GLMRQPVTTMSVQRKISAVGIIQAAQNPLEIAEVASHVLDNVETRHMPEMGLVNRTWHGQTAGQIHTRGTTVGQIRQQRNDEWWRKVKLGLLALGVTALTIATLGVLYYTDWDAFRQQLRELVEEYMRSIERREVFCRENPLACAIDDL